MSFSTAAASPGGGDEASARAPEFAVAVFTDPRPPGSPVESLDGRLWGRVVFAPAAEIPANGNWTAIAAEDETGQIHVWDSDALFLSLFPRE